MIVDNLSIEELRALVKSWCVQFKKDAINVNGSASVFKAGEYYKVYHDPHYMFVTDDNRQEILIDSETAQEYINGEHIKVDDNVVITGPPVPDDIEASEDWFGCTGRVIAVRNDRAYVFMCWYPFSSLRKTS